MNRSKNDPSQPFQLFHLQPEQSGLTLAAALKAMTEPASWGTVKQWIAKRHVQVNGNLCLDEARRVTEKDVIKLWKDSLAKPVDTSDVRIAHLDEHLVVVEKPAGVTSVRHFHERTLSTKRRQLQPTLEELLPPVLAKMQRLRWPPLPPKGMNRGRQQTNQKRQGSSKHVIQNSKKLPPELQVIPVHRLDRDTSGLMIFARNHLAEQRLIAMFRRHTIEREYVGVCLGVPEPQTLRSWLIRDRGDGQRGSLPADATDEAKQAAQEAITHIRRVEPVAGGKYAKIFCQLETGRTHQIRIHLSEVGHMLCGDKIYSRKSNGELLTDLSGAPRHALHSNRLSFTHPITGEQHVFHMSMPPDLQSWLKRLAGESKE